jgi:molecular chaperone HscB
MKYFELFGLAPRLNVDAHDLERRFHDLSRQHHPDFHTSQSPEKRADALETTALLNDAYRTLREPTRRAEYLVRSEGCKVDGSKVPQEMLMEVFEINEGLDDLRTAKQAGRDVGSHLEAVEAFRRQVTAKREAYDEELTEAFTTWDGLLDADAPEDRRRQHLERLADILSQASYIRNLERELDNEVAN